MSASKVIQSIASVVPRNYVLMEVKENLLPEGRKANLMKFPSATFKRVARVAMGEPDSAFKKMVKDKLLKVKQEKAVKEWEAKKAKVARQKADKERKEKAEKAK